MVLQSLNIFVNFVLAGDVASLAQPYFFGATLTALNKKLDFKNAFNCLHRQKILYAVRDQMPELLPLVLSTYGAPSCLLFGQDIIQSSEGVQQGDPLGSCCSASRSITW